MTTSMTPLVGRLDGEDLIATQVRLEEETHSRALAMLPSQLLKMILTTTGASFSPAQ